jgi:hypothetical protein
MSCGVEAPRAERTAISLVCVTEYHHAVNADGRERGGEEDQQRHAKTLPCQRRTKRIRVQADIGGQLAIHRLDFTADCRNQARRIVNGGADENAASPVYPLFAREVD